MLPMGTIVTVCMFAAVITASGIPVLRHMPDWMRKGIAWIVMAAGLWNTLWYGLQHLTEFWGLAALVSGTLMFLVSLYILGWSRLPDNFLKAKPVVLVVLSGYALMYAITIYRL